MYGVLKNMVKLNDISFFLCEAQNFLNSPRILLQVYDNYLTMKKNNVVLYMK